MLLETWGCTYLFELVLRLPPFLPSQPSRSLQSARLDSLCYLATSCILYMIAYRCQCYFLNSSHLPLPTLCTKICSLCEDLYSCSTNRFICTILLDSTFMHWYTIFVFLRGAICLQFLPRAVLPFISVLVSLNTLLSKVKVWSLYWYSLHSSSHIQNWLNLVIIANLISVSPGYF